MTSRIHIRDAKPEMIDQAHQWVSQHPFGKSGAARFMAAHHNSATRLPAGGAVPSTGRWWYGLMTEAF
jgi:hypothetical protein